MGWDIITALQRVRLRQSAVHLGRIAHRHSLEAEQALQLDDLREFVIQFRVEPGPGMVVVGRSRDEHGKPFWVGLSIKDFLEQSVSISTSGASGSGKSYGALAIILQLLLDGSTPIVIVDLKGELSVLVLDVAIPALIALGVDSERLLGRLRVIRPFDQSRVPLLRITRSEPEVPRDVQARSIATTLCAGMDDELGLRMERIVLRLIALLIECDLPLPQLLDWLDSPTLLQRDARQSKDPATRRYVAEMLTRENRTSIDAVRSRIDLFFLNEATRLALSAPSCMSFSDCLESGITVIDVGDPPAGAERLARFWSSVLLSRLTRAALAREVHANSPHSLLVFEEFQEGLGRDERAQFVRLLTQVRWKRSVPWFINQAPAQIAAVDPLLLKLLRTNVGIEILFRSAYEDARAIAHAMPADRVRKGKEGGSKREDSVEQLTRLRRREFLIWPKERARAHLCRSPRIDMDALRAAADRVPKGVRDLIRAGTVSLPADEVRAALAKKTGEEHRPRPRVSPFLEGESARSKPDALGLG